MKRLALCVVLSGVIFAAAAADAPATDPSPSVATAAPATVDASSTDADGNPLKAKPTRTDRGCIQQTGSRIRARNQEGKCNGEPGSSYSRDDLRNTGRPDLGDALRTLDTAIF